MRRLALLAAALALAPPALALLAPPPRLTATPVAIDPHDRAHVRIGELSYLGGWVLRSQDRRFGGISSMTVQGDRIAALSDTSFVFWLRANATGVALDGIQSLPAVPNGGTDKIDRDSESSAIDPATGRIWVGFETTNQIWRYAPGYAAGEAHAAPRDMAKWPGNLGAETIVRLRDGRFLVMEETGAVRPDGANMGLLFPGDPTAPGVKPIVFAYRPPAGFAITDGVQLPSGHILLLHRRFSLSGGIEAALTVFDPAQIVPDALLQGRNIAYLAAPLTVDNMEALAITREGGRDVLWIASDDNYSPVQRSLLLRFAFDPKL
ncbi:MAG: esterase-like activity of phytase family protein [Sphingomonadaceae bacterium]|nr:esterase-like activity of phytase family protein [Sphingomonadaceae bacterium]